MPWRIINNNTGKGVESHETPKAAQRAMLILSAHDIKNGRKADYRIEPQIIIPNTIDELDLPSWAYQVFVGDLIEQKAAEPPKMGLAAAMSDHLREKREEPSKAAAALDVLEAAVFNKKYAREGETFEDAAKRISAGATDEDRDRD